MKPDERDFLLAVYRNELLPKAERQLVKHLIQQQTTIHENRCYYLLQKWANKGWYEYGVTIGCGWLTPEGKQVAEALAGAMSIRSRKQQKSWILPCRYGRRASMNNPTICMLL